MPLKMARIVLILSLLAYAFLMLPAGLVMLFPDSPALFVLFILGLFGAHWAAIAIGMSAAACVMIQAMSVGRKLRKPLLPPVKS